MSLTQLPPKTVQGALVQLFPGNGLAGIANAAVPNIVQFDINPEKLTRVFTPWRPEADEATPQPGARVQPITVPEKFSQFEISIDPYARKSSVIPVNFLTVEARVAALRKMIEPSKGFVGDLLTSASDLLNIEQDYEPPEVAPVLLWLGARIILPVQIETLTINELQHNALYFPVRATATMDLKVLTPDYFRCSSSATAEIAIAAYEYTRAQRDLTAIVNVVDLSPLWRLVAPI
jgi:hypothetical protein